MTKKKQTVTKSAVLEELRKDPNVGRALRRLRVPTPIFYEWKRTDRKFWEIVTLSIELRTDWASDLAEEKLIELILKGNLAAIKYQLDNNHPRYKKASMKSKSSSHDNIDQLSLADLIRLANN